MRRALLSLLPFLIALPALAAPAPAGFGARLDLARAGYVATVSAPVTASDWELRYRPSGWFQPPQPPALAAYDSLVREVSRTAWASDPGDPYFRRKALWVRPYASDATHMRVLEVMDRAQALGITEVYLETFYGGRVSYTGGRAFPARWPGVNVARAYAREARYRGIKLYAWMHTLRWGEDQVRRGEVEGVIDGFGKSPRDAEGPGSAFVSPSSPAVRARLGDLLDEVAGLGYFDGVWLDYLRYPLAARGARAPVDPRNFWGYGPSARLALANYRPDLATPEFDQFLRDGTAPDPITKAGWLDAYHRFLTHELRDVLTDARTRLAGKLRLGLVFHPGAAMRPHDARAQDGFGWLSLCDEASAMCYAYDPALDPFDTSETRGTIDRELIAVEAAAAATDRRPALLASLAGDPPGGGVQGRRHWPLMAQLAYLKGRRLEGAFPHLDGVALFSYGWLWPASDASRRVGEAPL